VAVNETPVNVMAPGGLPKLIESVPDPVDSPPAGLLNVPAVVPAKLIDPARKSLATNRIVANPAANHPPASMLRRIVLSSGKGPRDA
jgi:hypothetical protein